MAKEGKKENGFIYTHMKLLGIRSVVKLLQYERVVRWGRWSRGELIFSKERNVKFQVQNDSFSDLVWIMCGISCDQIDAATH